MLPPKELLPNEKMFSTQTLQCTENNLFNMPHLIGPILFLLFSTDNAAKLNLNSLNGQFKYELMICRSFILTVFL
jgi:hypothetical protein